MFELHNDLVSLVLSFLWNVTAKELEEDINYYIEWRQNVPPIFLKACVYDEKRWHEVPSPFVWPNAYTPRKHTLLLPKEIWSPYLMTVGNFLHRESVRELRTYKGIILRWIDDCTSTRKLFYYYTLRDRFLTRLKPSHFLARAPRSFVAEVLRQVSFYIPSASGE